MTVSKTNFTSDKIALSLEIVEFNNMSLEKKE
jgi:hypothetical protein